MECSFKEDMVKTKNEILEKLRLYATNPDDDNIRIKEKIKDIFYHSPELLYALNEKELESELFDENGNVNVDENGEPLGEWDRYFGATGNIRPFIFFPEAQTEMRNYICYTTDFYDLDRYNSTEKYFRIIFSIIVYGINAIDELTGISRHDLIASIIREKIAWRGDNFTFSNAVPVSDKETTTDDNFIVRTLVFQAKIPNSLSTTYHGKTFYSNKGR